MARKVIWYATLIALTVELALDWALFGSMVQNELRYTVAGLFTPVDDSLSSLSFRNDDDYGVVVCWKNQEWSVYTKYAHDLTSACKSDAISSGQCDSIAKYYHCQATHTYDTCYKDCCRSSKVCENPGFRGGMVLLLAQACLQSIVLTIAWCCSATRNDMKDMYEFLIEPTGCGFWIRFFANLIDVIASLLILIYTEFSLLAAVVLGVSACIQLSSALWFITKHCCGFCYNQISSQEF